VLKGNGVHISIHALIAVGVNGEVTTSATAPLALMMIGSLVGQVVVDD
jgi:hypothetical protein